jgi:hypothetical protein
MNTSSTTPKSSAAFTRLDLLTVLATLGVLASVAGPGLANNKPHSQRAVCSDGRSGSQSLLTSAPTVIELAQTTKRRGEDTRPTSA